MSEYDLMSEIPRELQLLILGYLNRTDFLNMKKAYTINLTENDYLTLLLRRYPEWNLKVNPHIKYKIQYLVATALKMNATIYTL